MFGNIIFRQLFDLASSTYTYVVGDPQSLAGRDHRLGLRAALPRSRAGGRTRLEAARRARNALPRRPRDRRVVDATGDRLPDRYFAALRCDAGGGPALRSWRPGGFRRTVSGSARYARPHRWMRHLRDRRPPHGVHRRLSADPRRRPLRFPARQRQHALPLHHRADLQSAGRLPDFSWARLQWPHHVFGRRGTRA